MNPASIILHDGTTHVNLRGGDISRFWSKVDKSAGPESCWPWKTGKSKKGYGYFSVKPFNIAAHRFAWSVTFGPAVGVLVCHKCDNPSCCNPAHLFVGSPSDNTKDMMAKRRNNPPRGERGSKHKLSLCDVAAIKSQLSSCVSQKEIALRFGVSQGAISRIKTGDTWML